MKQSRRKILGGLFWSYAERIGAQMVSMLVTIVLARLIAPEEYGVISLVTVFISLANTFVSDGFGNALVQKKNSDNLDFSSMLFFSLGVSVILFLILFAVSPLVAAYYAMPALTSVMRVMAIRIPIAAINSIQRAYVSKRMEFKKFFYSTLIGTVISAFVGIGMAYVGFGVWALVAQYLTNSVIDTFVLAITTRWKPVWKISFARLKPLVSFGWKILAVALMTTLYSNLRNLIIGKQYSSEELAFSNKGQQFPSIISVNINTSITTVIFPVISESQDDLPRVLSLTRRTIKVGTFLMAPILLGLAAIATPVVRILLTDKWLPCVPYMQIMCVVYLLQPIQTASLQAMKALGQSALYMKLEIVKKVFGLLVLLISMVFFHSVLVIILSALVAEIISTVINFPANKKLLNYSYMDQIIDVGKPLVAAFLMWILLDMLSTFTGTGLLGMLVSIPVGAALYLFFCLLFRNDSLDYVGGILKIGIRKRCA